MNSPLYLVAFAIAVSACKSSESSGGPPASATDTADKVRVCKLRRDGVDRESKESRSALTDLRKQLTAAQKLTQTARDQNDAQRIKAGELREWELRQRVEDEDKILAKVEAQRVSVEAECKDVPR